MASVTANIKIQSPDVSNDVLSLEVAYNMTTDGSAGVDELIGISRKSGLNVKSVLFSATTYPNGGIVYIKNLDSTYANGVLIELGLVEVGSVAGGEAYLIPWNADEDFSVTADVAGTLLEYALFLK